MIMVFTLGYNPAKHMKRLHQNKLDVIKKQFRKTKPIVFVVQ